MPTTAAVKPHVSLGEVETPLGRVAIACSEVGLTALALPGGDWNAFTASLRNRWTLDGKVGSAGAWVERTVAELDSYFKGCLHTFTLALAPKGTSFQQQVWQAVCAVPYGETRTYGQVAESLGRPQAARAVGHANGANPLPIVVPCHRLVGSDGGLTGYGGGLEMKRWLIAHERRHALGAR